MNRNFLALHFLAKNNRNLPHRGSRDVAFNCCQKTRFLDIISGSVRRTARIGEPDRPGSGVWRPAKHIPGSRYSLENICEEVGSVTPPTASETLALPGLIH